MTTGDRRQTDDGHPSITPAIEPSAEVAAVLAEAIGADTAETAGVLARYRHDPAWKLLAAFVGGLCVNVAATPRTTQR